MLAYVTAFVLVASLVMYATRRPISDDGGSAVPNLWLGVATVFLITMVGLRHEVGGDWDFYLRFASSLHNEPLTGVLSSNDPAYLFVNWLGANVFGGIYTANTLCAVFLMTGLFSFCKHQPQPLLALLVAIPYLVFVVGMGYTRQSAALGLVLVAMSALYNGQVGRYLLWVLLAALFHKTALFMLPFAIFVFQRNKLFWISLLLIIGVLATKTFVWPHLDFYLSLYVTSGYESAGAAVRLTMTALLAMLFVMLRRRFAFDKSLQNYWMSLSFVSFFLLTLVFVFPHNTTPIDRLGLYLLPLQLMVLSHLPSVLNIKKLSRSFITLLVVLYSAMVLLAWLFLANHAEFWLPYQFYPWVWLSS